MSDGSHAAGRIKDSGWAKWAGLAVAAVMLLLIGRSCSGPAQQSGAAPSMSILSGPTTVVTSAPRPAIDPLAGLGSPVNPTALALVGPDYAARLELVRSFTATVQRFVVSGCSVYIGADAAGVWDLSTVQGPSHPVRVLMACPDTPVTTAVPAK